MLTLALSGMVSGAASWTHRFLGAGAGAEARASGLLCRPRLKSGLEGGLLPLLATPKLLLADASLLMGWASCTACLTAQAAIAGAQLSQSCTMGFPGWGGKTPCVAFELHPCQTLALAVAFGPTYAVAAAAGSLGEARRRVHAGGSLILAF